MSANTQQPSHNKLANCSKTSQQNNNKTGIGKEQNKNKENGQSLMRFASLPPASWIDQQHTSRRAPMFDGLKSVHAAGKNVGRKGGKNITIMGKNMIMEAHDTATLSTPVRVTHTLIFQHPAVRTQQLAPSTAQALCNTLRYANATSSCCC